MGTPAKHIPVKLIVGLISKDPSFFDLARQKLEKKFGSVDAETPVLDFLSTHYYDEELGEGLKRKFISFERLIALHQNYRIKSWTNRLEARLSKKNRRLVNIDPGYISLSKLILFTTKDRSHRTYLDNGIFADLELVFVNKTFKPLEWTYPDYRSTEYIDFFNRVRSEYAARVKKQKTGEGKNAS